MGFSGAIRVRAERLMKCPNAIRVWAERIRVRIDILIGISGVIRIFTFSRKRSLQKMVRKRV